MATSGLIDVNLLSYYNGKLQNEFFTNELEANRARIKIAEVTESLTAASASFSNMGLSRLTVTGKAIINNLDVDNAITSGSVTSDNVNGNYISANNSVTTPLLNASSISANEISAGGKIQAPIGEFETIKVDHLEADSLGVEYLKADGANMTEAMIKKLFVETGILEEAIIEDGYVTGYLNAVHIRADSIVANKLSLLGPDGLYYALNTEGATEGQTLENALDGSHIIAESITASKIRVTDLVAFGATIGGWTIDNTALRSRLKQSYNDAIPGVYLGSGLKEVETYLLDENGNYLLDEDGERLYFTDLSTQGKYTFGFKCEPDANGFASHMLLSNDGIDIRTPNFIVNRATGAVQINGTFTVADTGLNVNDAINDATQAVADIQDAIENGDFDGEDATLVMIDSSAGNLFKNNLVSTVLTVVIYHGSTIISNYSNLIDEYGISAHLQWYFKEINDTDWSTVLASDSRLSANGFAFSLTPNDVTIKTIFKCELVV